jgi:2-polyprenyl-6-hydroxyphenyl methylase/3-demethylubiquinone-9 3-methyltransferase
MADDSDAAMDRELEQSLNSLPRLGRAARDLRKCKVCASDAPLFDVVDFLKRCKTPHDTPYNFGLSGIQVKYHRCICCDFLFTNLIDDWTSGEIARYIYNEDYILVDPEYQEDRPAVTAAFVAGLLDGCQSLRILDYGSGSGKFAERMRERGFPSVTSYDPFSYPRRPEGHFDLVTAFEVVEHAPRPIDTFAEMTDFMAADGALLVGQTIQPANIEEIRGAWWYLAPRNGHVSTYSDLTFAMVANKLDLSYRRSGNSFWFTRSSLSPSLERILPRIGPLLAVHALVCPAEASHGGAWHELERNPFRFRWTASDRITWDNRLLVEGLNRFVTPFVMEIVDGFAGGCRFVLDGADLPTTVQGKKLVAEANIASQGFYTVALRTPPPLSPRELGHAADDERKLGLAIPP